ncbi:MAG: DUF1499 domain-containing protein [Bacteriovoracaceae bacterium]|nr:DUF1499 domain-containing protein [Bacteriovoracaceae bacterium]
MKYIILVVLVLVSFFTIRFIMLGNQSATMKPTLGLEKNRLKPCESNGNCIVSHDLKDSELAPITNTSNPIDKLKDICTKQGFEIVETREDYLYVLDASKIFGFVDDVEFFYDKEAQTLHFRSASRVGKSDLGANSKRVRQILELLK